MLSPGALHGGHAGLAGNCFACHAPLRGASAERCIKCHALATIGVRNSKGEPLPKRSVKTAFHQQLVEQDCMACHTDHAGPLPGQRSRKPFMHRLLRSDLQERCEACHDAPANKIHNDLSVSCGQCHQPAAWKPASFSHALLAPALLEQCADCHKAPANNLHSRITGNCRQCHATEHWKPATFDHDKFFRLDGDHNASCVTCHASDDYRRYSCYGCHEHEQSRVEAKHVREGIRDFSNCVQCHRSGSGEHEGRGSGERRERD
jgi:hypothetical protein